MRYLVQPRGPGTAYQFRMRAPAALVGRIDRETGRPFGAMVKRGLGTPHLPTARKRRDEVLGKLRAAERETERGAEQFSAESADRWAQTVAEQDAAGGPDRDELDVREVARDMIEAAEALPRSRRPAPEAAESFKRKVLRPGMKLDKAAAGYVEARAAGNRGGFKPLARSTELGLQTAVRLLVEFMKRPADEIALADVTAEEARRFRTEFLPGRVSKRAPQGLSWKSSEKHVTLLAGLWRWARETKHLAKAPDPWKAERLVPRARKRAEDECRQEFTAEETAKVLAGLPPGDRLGDLFRVLLMTGCRVDEVAQLRVADVDEDATGFTVRAGKTENARRWVPVPERAQGPLRSRMKGKAGDARVFPEFPIRKASGKAAAASQAFTRERRRLLGAESDGRLALHSARHTWRTAARRAGVPEDVVNELGGWAGPKRSSSVYDHGLLRGQLAEAQEKVAEWLFRGKYLGGF